MTRTISRPWPAMALAMLLSACGGGDPAPTDSGVDPGEPVRWWSFSEFHVGTADEQHLLAEGYQLGGTLLENRVFGPVQEWNDHGVGLNPHDDGEANGQIFSDPTGATYWVWAQAPNDRGVPVTGTVVGSFTKLVQVQRFRKLASNATFKYVVSDAFAYAFDGNNRRNLCPDSNPYCDGVLRAMVSIEVRAAAVLDDGLSTLASTFHHAAGILSLEGYTNQWQMGANTYRFASHTLWSSADFIQDPDIGGIGGQFATIALIRPLPIDVDISSVAVDGEFDVLVSAWTSVRDGRGRESYLSAFLKDPRLTTGGIGFESTGLLAVKSEPSTIPAGLNAPGTIEFLRPAYQAEESAGPGGAEVAILRVGGSRGEVSVMFSTADGSATAGADYETQRTTVTFKDGDDAPRFVRVPLVPDTQAEGIETVLLTLSDAQGGAVLGAQSSAELQILNSTPPVSSFTLGGTLSGLVGTGLLLDGPFGSLAPTANGPFTMPGTLVDTLPYTVRVLHQPENPAQVCTVTNASGVVAGANVTNVQVACVTTVPVSGLDTSFGSGGQVAVANPGGAGEGLAVQPDGKILVAASGTGNFTLLRLLPDGSLDAGFGSAGIVSTDFGGNDDAYGMALQGDGRVVVVGRVQIAGGYDFGMARYEADGRLDASFGSGGKFSVDFAGGTDYAWAVVIQADGKIVVGGQASASGRNVFGLLRLRPDGSLDTGFGSGGKVQTVLGTGGALAYDLALAPDGKLVLAGVAQVGTSDQFAAARYSDDGSLDGGFGTQGIALVSVQSQASARGVQVLADGSVLLAGGSASGVRNDIALVKLDALGKLDTSFGGGTGKVTTNLSGGRDSGMALAVQADGRIVVAGYRAAAAGDDMAVLRYLADGQADAGFGSAGALAVDHAGGIDRAQALVLQADGRIVAAGQGFNGRIAEIVVLRVLP